MLRARLALLLFSCPHWWFVAIFPVLPVKFFRATCGLKNACGMKGVDDAQCVISPGFVARFGFPTLLPAMVMIRWCSRADHEC
ncbi:hypothetical protein FZX15_14845 [Brucella suis bv. 1]|nr:hypothetical protein FZX15_14845 [Brucella suis bv. 1]